MQNPPPPPPPPVPFGGLARYQETASSPPPVAPFGSRPPRNPSTSTSTSPRPQHPSPNQYRSPRNDLKTPSSAASNFSFASSWEHYEPNIDGYPEEDEVVPKRVSSIPAPSVVSPRLKSPNSPQGHLPRTADQAPPPLAKDRKYQRHSTTGSGSGLGIIPENAKVKPIPGPGRPTSTQYVGYIPRPPSPPRVTIDPMTVDDTPAALRIQRPEFRTSITEHGSLPKRMGTLRSALSRTLSRAGTSASRRNSAYQPVDDGNYGPGIDISSFDSAIPEAAVMKMQEKGGDGDFAYTADGDAVDLSSFAGADMDSDRASLLAKGGKGGPKEKKEESYYFPEDPDKPNWKPHTMRTPYLAILLILSLAGIGLIEYLWFLARYNAEQMGVRTPHLLAYKDLNSDVNIIQYSIWKYLPTLLTVIYGVMWELTDAQVKRVEPYFQLSQRPRGARAEASLNVEYLTFWAVLTPIQAIRHKHWAIMVSSLAAQLAVLGVQPLSGAVLELKPDLKERKANKNVTKYVTMDPVFTRLMEAALVFIAVAALSLLIIFRRRNSGLLGDPSGIAGVAAMANNAHILTDFDGLDLASEEEIHKALSKRTYILHKAALYQGEFLKASERRPAAVKAQNPHPLMLRAKGGIPFMVFVVGFAILLVLSKQSRLAAATEKVPWLYLVFASNIKMIWSIIDRDLRILEPFYILYGRKAQPWVLTMDLTSIVPGYFAIQQVFAGRYFLAHVGLVTILTEVLTVCVGSINTASGQESVRSTQISLALAIGILILILITTALVLKSRSKAFLPRQPGTIASILAFIHQSNMLLDFSGTEKMTTAQRRKLLMKKGHTYAFGWYRGRDGKNHVGIDENDHIMRPYKFGELIPDGGMNAAPMSDFEYYDGMQV